MKAEIQNCLTWYANKVEELHTYHWGPEFRLKELKESHDQFVAEIKKHIDLEKLTVEEAKELRFRRWDDNLPTLYLFPLWLVPIIPEGMECISISGSAFKYSSKTADNDIRFGCVSYGIHIKER